MVKDIMLRVSPERYRLIRENAYNDDRSMNNYLNRILDKYLKDN